MSAHKPPIPPANRSDKGPGESAGSGKKAGGTIHPAKAPNNADEEGQTGNTRINTTHQGHQQDR